MPNVCPMCSRPVAHGTCVRFGIPCYENARVERLLCEVAVVLDEIRAEVKALREGWSRA